MLKQSFPQLCGVIKPLSLLALVILGLLTVNPVAANQVTLAFVNNGQLAFAKASWSVFKRDDQERQHPVAVLPRHTGVVNLSEGEYIARLTVGGQVHETSFKVDTGGRKLVSLPID